PEPYRSEPYIRHSKQSHFDVLCSGFLWADIFELLIRVGHDFSDSKAISANWSYLPEPIGMSDCLSNISKAPCCDNEDKLLDRKRRKDKVIKQNGKHKVARMKVRRNDQ
ncbi:hypothetical protein Tco_1295748, partial [Tanacetum coccineum]